MAELFLARERQIAGVERLVVIKRILPHLASQQSFVDMFLREARIAARLAHPNIVQVYELNEEQGSYYMAMEYVHGSTVRELQLLAQEAGIKFPIEVAVAIFDQAARGLHATHELKDLDGNPLGLIHRDISPHNLMVTKEGNVKLLDFGVAKATEGIESTYSGNLKGKFAYMSPEQCMRTNLDRRSDLWALGIVIWELCVGERLFKRSNELEMMQAITNGDVARPSALGRALPIRLEDAIMKALNVDRNRRFDTVEHMRQDLVGAARQAGMNVGADRVADFVHEIAGNLLTSRDVTLKNALERSLTSGESAALLHRTGSQTFEGEIAETKIDNAAAENSASQDIVDIVRAQVNEKPVGGDAGETAETIVSNIIKDVDLDEPLNTRTTTKHQAAKEPTQTSASAEHKISDPPKKSGSSALNVAMVFVALIAVSLFGYFLYQRLNPTAPDPAVEAPVLLGEPMPFGWAPTVDPEVLKEEIQPLRAYLEKTLGRPVPQPISKDYNELGDELVEGKISFAMMPPFLYVTAKEKAPGITPLVFKGFDGSTTSDGHLLIRSDSDYKKLEDLKGKSFCFTDESSTTGNFLPRAYIRQNGYDPKEFIGAEHWSGDHMQVMRDLLDNKCEAAATYNGALITGRDVGIKTGKIRTLAITGHIPQDVIVAGPGVSKTEANKMREALLNFDPKKEIGEPMLGKTQRIESFLPAEDEAYDSLRAAIKANESAKDEGKDED